MRHKPMPQHSGTKSDGCLRILIVEDHRIMRKCLKSIIDSQEDMQCIGLSIDGSDAVPLALQSDPDVILVDRYAPGLDGVSNVQRMRHAIPGARVIGMATEAEGCQDLSEAGADMVCTKHQAIARIAGIIRDVMNQD